MFSPMEVEYFEKFINAQFQNVHSKLDAQINLQKIANGRVYKLEQEVHELNKWRATSQGHWKGIILMSTFIGFVIGIIAVYLWH